MQLLDIGYMDFDKNFKALEKHKWDVSLAVFDLFE